MNTAYTSDDPENISDGRLRKGEQRRRLLVNATMDVITNEGVTAVSQRRVAAEAGVPPSTVTYYYATIDDLLVDALTRVNNAYVAVVEGLPEDPDEALRGFATLIAEGVGPDRAHALAEMELFLLAARRPALGEQVDCWYDAVDAFFALYLPDPAARAGVIAASDGYLLRCCVMEPPPSADEVYRALRRLIDRERDAGTTPASPSAPV
ncbi:MULTISPECIES: TetR/AcrR family transcriptional regulator [Nocardiopsis]|uniref:TetR family transcriptional regulator n=2 Tax=Nocardiopsis alba TaxID=53437 RepID=A0ABV5DVS0_9ACTN|nr:MULTISPECIES: TetR family transcriptional regulator [Nocardiopsis]AFR09654.1 bacterial regulatory s, tetR family protein [Nocardiopsis alba ATCC BAA-2165]MEC3893596.1 TetR family transcriptional regulator [Nocardiopsis sp. LDBS1602]